MKNPGKGREDPTPIRSGLSAPRLEGQAQPKSWGSRGHTPPLSSQASRPLPEWPLSPHKLKVSEKKPENIQGECLQVSMMVITQQCVSKNVFNYFTVVLIWVISPTRWYKLPTGEARSLKLPTLRYLKRGAELGTHVDMLRSVLQHQLHRVG